jgi:hypothetical protein
MSSILDLGAVLMTHGTYATNQSFAPIQAYPRQLPTCAVIVHMLTPPVASATLTLEVASTQNGVYSPITSVVWPAGVSGSKQLPIGANSSRAWIANNQAIWARLSVTTTGAFTGSAWVTKSSDGSFGLASRSYALDVLGPL